MKKMLTTKAIMYAKKLWVLEKKLEDPNIDNKRKKELQKNIEDIIDEVCENYEPTAMYKIDEQVYILEKQEH